MNDLTTATAASERPSHGGLGGLSRARALLLAAAALVALAAGVAVALINDDASPSDPSSVAGAGEMDLFPSEQLADWTTYANQLSVFTVLDEEILPPPPPPTTSGGLILREVTLQIDRTLWQREGVPTVDGSIAIRTWGSLEQNGVRVRQAPLDGPRLEVGQRYLAPIVHHCGEWFPLSDTATVTLDGNTVTSKVELGAPTPAAAALQGTTVDDAAARVSNTPVLPEARTAGPELAQRLAATGIQNLGC